MPLLAVTTIGGHEFEYESRTDLFRCSECRVYEVQARDAGGTIKPCTGLVGYGGDTARVCLLLTENPALTPNYGTSLAWQIHETGIGRVSGVSSRDGKMLVESAPSVVDKLARQIEPITFTVGGLQVPAVTSVEHLTAGEGRAIIAANRAAYIAEYGEDA
ncbi:hypothetical protein [Actinomadura sp. 6N118]|uniref:hypothetical protein n=1 Tax=Actinomadura sp. 6N118 TaxID=3375151 RepID=UPI0037900E86